MNDYTLFDVDMKVTPISKYRKEAYAILEKKRYSLQNLRKLKVGGHIPTYLHTLTIGLEYLLSRNLYYELPEASEAFVEETVSLKDRLPSRRSYKKIGTQPYKKGDGSQPDAQYKAQLRSNMTRARNKLQKIFNTGLKVKKGKLTPKL